MKREVGVLLLIFAFFSFQGCATTLPPAQNQPLIPLKEANLEVVLQQNEGLEMLPEDAKDVRDFYRLGVQQKSRAEDFFKDKNYPEAMKQYRSSNDSFSDVLRYLYLDSAEFPLFEGTQILFLPNLLVADNELKMGLILRAMGREEPARRRWKQGLTSVQKSLQSERTEWGLSLQKQLISLLPAKNN